MRPPESPVKLHGGTRRRWRSLPDKRVSQSCTAERRPRPRLMVTAQAESADRGLELRAFQAVTFACRRVSRARKVGYLDRFVVDVWRGARAPRRGYRPGPRPRAFRRDNLMTEFKTKSGMFSRRGLLKAGAAAGAVGVASPWIIRGSMASSGELNFIGWAGYDEFPSRLQGVRGQDRHQGELHRLRQPGRDGRPGAHRRRHERVLRHGRAHRRPPPELDRQRLRRSPGTRARSTSRASDPAFLQGGAANMTMRQGQAHTARPRCGAARRWRSTPRKRRSSSARPS